MIAVDSNILVYAHREDSPHHQAARAVVEELATGRAAWGIPWPCVHEFLAITTHPRIFEPPSELPVAMSAIQRLVDTPGVTLLGESRDHLELLSQLLRRSSATGPRVHDARIAAICLGHGVTELLSADRDFTYFPALRTRNPLVATD